MSKSKVSFQMEDYDPVLRCFSHIRHTRYLLGEGVTEELLLKELERYPNAAISKIISHTPVPGEGAEKLKMNIYELSERQRVFVDGVPYIDGFGFHVYVGTYINLYGMKDEDHRAVPEIEHFKPSRHDLLHRQSS